MTVCENEFLTCALQDRVTTVGGVRIDWRRKIFLNFNFADTVRARICIFSVTFQRGIGKGRGHF